MSTYRGFLFFVVVCALSCKSALLKASHGYVPAQLAAAGFGRTQLSWYISLFGIAAFASICVHVVWYKFGPAGSLHGPRWLMLTVTWAACLCSSSLLASYVHVYWLLLLSRGLQGWGCCSALWAMMAEFNSRNAQGSLDCLFQAVAGGSFAGEILGPVIGTLVANWGGLRSVFVLQATLVAIAWFTSALALWMCGSDTLALSSNEISLPDIGHDVCCVDLESDVTHSVCDRSGAVVETTPAVVLDVDAPVYCKQSCNPNNVDCSQGRSSPELSVGTETNTPSYTTNNSGAPKDKLATDKLAEIVMVLQGSTPKAFEFPQLEQCGTPTSKVEEEVLHDPSSWVTLRERHQALAEQKLHQEQTDSGVTGEPGGSYDFSQGQILTTTTSYSQGTSPRDVSCVKANVSVSIEVPRVTMTQLTRHVSPLSLSNLVSPIEAHRLRSNEVFDCNINPEARQSSATEGQALTPPISNWLPLSDVSLNLKTGEFVMKETATLGASSSPGYSLSFSPLLSLNHSLNWLLLLLLSNTRLVFELLLAIAVQAEQPYWTISLLYLTEGAGCILAQLIVDSIPSRPALSELAGSVCVVAISALFGSLLYYTSCLPGLFVCVAALGFFLHAAELLGANDMNNEVQCDGETLLPALSLMHGVRMLGVAIAGFLVGVATDIGLQRVVAIICCAVLVGFQACGVFLRLLWY